MKIKTKRILNILLMKKLGSVFMCLIYSSIFLVSVSANGQNLQCVENIGKANDVYVDVPLKDAYYLNYETYFKDSTKYVVSKTIDTTSAESVIAQNNVLLFSQGVKLKFNRRFSFVYNLDKYVIIRYQIIYADGRLENKISQFQSKNGIWVDAGIDVNKELVYLLNVLTPQGFWCFYSKENQNACSEINKLKSRTKNFDGTVNIDKLNAVVKNNQASLVKYLDK